MTSNFIRRSIQFAVAICVAGMAFTAAHAVPAPAPLHIFMEVRMAPNKLNMITVEGETSPSGGAPTIRDLILRSTNGKTTISIKLPCGKVEQCWPESPAWTPDSKKITFALRSPGSHARSIYQVDVDGKNLKKLISFNGTISDLMYNKSGQLAMLATENATKELGAVEAAAPISGDLDAPSPEQRIAILEKNKLRWASPANLFVYEYDWMPDGSGFVGTAAEGDGDNNWWVAKLYTFHNAQPTVLYTPADAKQQLANPVISHDGKNVAFIVGIMSDFGSTGGDIFTIPVSGGTAINITPKLAASVTAIEWTCANSIRANVEAGDHIQFVDFGNGFAPANGDVLWQGQESVYLDPTRHTDTCTSPQTAMVHQTFTVAPEIAVGEVGKWSDFTHRNGHLKTSYPVQSLHWNSDQFSIQGWLILPDDASARTEKNKKIPLITVIHGGPAAAYRPRFIDIETRKLLDTGDAVFLPNPRGSYGQGEEFTAANVKDFGYGDLRDILSGVDAAIATGPIDSQRLGIMGHSYGGFMTMWAVTQTNRFKAAVAGAGISNWLSYYGENGIDEWMIPYFGASVYDNPDVYAKSSPINFIKNVKTPTLSLVGAADLECPAPQTQEFGHALKALGVPSSTIIYPGEGHVFRDPATLADQEKRTLDWFAKYLGSGASTFQKTN